MFGDAAEQPVCLGGGATDHPVAGLGGEVRCGHPEPGENVVDGLAVGIGRQPGGDGVLEHVEQDREIGLGLENIEYEPEQFPGLVYRLDDPDVVALLFGSGKLVITGGKKPEDAEEAVDKIVSDRKSVV